MSRFQSIADTPGEPSGLMTDGSVMAPFNLLDWVAANSEHFKPPVGNKYLYSGRDFFVMIIKGPNARNDFHQVDSEEFFIQLKGDVHVKTIEEGVVKIHKIREFTPDFDRQGGSSGSGKPELAGQRSSMEIIAADKVKQKHFSDDDTQKKN